MLRATRPPFFFTDAEVRAAIRHASSGVPGGRRCANSSVGVIGAKSVGLPGGGPGGVRGDIGGVPGGVLGPLSATTFSGKGPRRPKHHRPEGPATHNNKWKTSMLHANSEVEIAPTSPGRHLTIQSSGK